MSLPKKGVITKICSISLFIFLMLFNVKVAFSDKSIGDINILGMKISIFVPSAYASQNCYWTCHNIGPCDAYTDLCRIYTLNSSCGERDWIKVSGWDGDYCQFW